MNSKRRFIAGAQCPHCGDQDSVVVEINDGEERVYCVTCQRPITDPEHAATVRDGETLIGMLTPKS